jgi:hypothetical protein
MTNDRWRALEMLAASANGQTEAILLAHGFTPKLLADLVNPSPATARVERMMAGGRARSR